MWTWTRRVHILLLDRRGQRITLSSEGAAEELAEFLAEATSKKLLIGAVNSPLFAYWRSEGAPLRLRREQRSAKNDSI
jgi:hypothetical protein